MSIDVAEEKTTNVDLTPRQQKIKDAIKEMISLRQDTGEPDFEEGWFEKGCKAFGTDLKTVTTIRELDNDIPTVVTDILGELTIPFMKEHPHITQVIVEDLDMGGNTLNIVMDSTRDRKDFIEVGYTVQATDNNPSLGSVRRRLSRLATEMLNG